VLTLKQNGIETQQLSLVVTMAGRVQVGISKKGRVSNSKKTWEGEGLKGKEEVWWSSKGDYSERNDAVVRKRRLFETQQI